MDQRSRTNSRSSRSEALESERSNGRQWKDHNNTLPSTSSFTRADSSEYTQIIRSSPVIVKVPVPLPRSVSFRKLEMESTAKFPSSAFLPTSSTNRPPIYETKEQRSKKRRSQSMDDIFNSQMKTFGKFLENPSGSNKAMSDCVPSSGSSYASSSGSNSTDSSSSPSCEIPLVERLIRTHPVWFLPSLQRSGALHLLQGREVGNFIVRSSTLPVTMAVSVKLPGNTVEHYLLRAVDNRIALENSTHTFQTVHQLIAHYSTVSDEIPVCLRVPSAIAEATTTQQLRSLALLGQEFWTHTPSSPKEILSPSDAELSKTFNSSGLGSQSSSSQTSLSEGRKPCRPTTLELGSSVCGVISAVTPPPVPPRWSRSTLLTPLSLPSSIQSTPSEVQTTFSEKGGRLVKKKKRITTNHSAKEPIHYKDTEILDIFRGTKTSYDDKASDYEDIWSPQQQQHLSISQTPQELPRLSTFKPDLIASSYGSDLDTLYKSNPTNNHKFQSLSAVNNNNLDLRPSQVFNNRNRLSFHGKPYSVNQETSEVVERRRADTMDKVTTTPTPTPTNPTKGILSKSKSSLYSEPVDSIVFRRNTSYRHSEPNIRWSQPAMMSLLNVDNHYLPDIPQSPDHGLGEDGQQNGQRLRMLRSSLVNVNRSFVEEDSGKENVGRDDGVKTRNSGSVTCVSVDNLCHLRDIRKRTKSKFNCGGGSGRQGSDDEETGANKQCVNMQVSPTEEQSSGTGVPTYKNETTITLSTANKNIVKPKPAPRKRSTDLNLKIEKERRQEHEILEVSTNTSWHLDNSWEFVNWEKGDAEGMMLASQKFPVPVGQTCVDYSNNNGGDLSQDEDQMNMNHPTLSCHRFSRYDNLDSRDLPEGEPEFEHGGGSGCGGDEMSDLENKEERISAPWDSSKWENLLRMVSESTHQLDAIQVPENTTTTTTLLDPGNFYGVGRELRSRESKLISESRQRISKILEVSGNVDKAGKTIAAVVRDLAENGSDFFGPTLKSFISCTIAAKSQDPFKVMQNVRQFISGMKNYLVGVSPESAELRNEIKRQRELLSECEFLNIDAILEEVLVDLVISPLNTHIRGLLQTHYDKASEPLKVADPPFPSYPFSFTAIAGTDAMKQESYDKLRKIIVAFEDFVSPIKKLDKWNEFVCEVQEMDNYSTDSFLPLLSEVMSCVCGRNMESHVDYMIGLLPRALADQNNYSISLLQSALAALKFRKDRKGSSTLTSIRVIVPDERNGTLIRKMVPIRDTTTTKDVAKIVASKVGIANPGDYVLVRIKDGEEKLCPEGELVSRFLEDSMTALAYKRMDAKIGWPLKIS